jgi:beta-glucosidase
MPAAARFPEGFLWGAATSAYQIEGSPLADGGGENIWHRFCRVPGAIANGDTGDVACDHYRRWAADVALMRELALGAYRFSIAWARVMPRGRGPVSSKGLDFYSRLVDALLEAGIAPMATLYHWDLPAALDDRGGWTNPDVAGWFADYAEVVFRKLADRVPMWATLNEPILVSDSGYLRGTHAPGHRSAAEAAATARHLLLAHGAAVRAYRALARQRIGLVVNLEPWQPATTDAADVAAAGRADAYMNLQYLDPVLLGRWPDGLAELYGGSFREFEQAEWGLVREPLDWIGVNYYSRRVTRSVPGAPPLPMESVQVAGAPTTALGWEVYPQGLTEMLVRVTERYGKLPLYVTENGAVYHDPRPGPDGVVDDPLRVDYLRRHLQAAGDAIAKGVDLRGYFAWSLLDNFEWQQGYRPRFGLVRVDYGTQERSLKRSATFYREVMRTNGEAVAGA